MAATNKFDKQVLDNIQGQNRAKFGQQESIAAPSTPDETEDVEVTREITVLMNGKRYQMVEENGSLFILLIRTMVQELPWTRMVTHILFLVLVEMDNACAGRLLVNARGGQLVKSGSYVAEYTANDSNPVNGEGNSSSN